MDHINSCDELHALIDSKTNETNTLCLEFSDLSFNFFLQLEWLDFIIRKNAKDKMPELSDEELSMDNLIKVTFTSCTFTEFDCSNISDQNLIEVNIIGGTINEFTCINSRFIRKFYINKQYSNNNEKIKINKLLISNTIFQNNFKLHNANVKIFSIEDTDFEKHADFFKSSFIQGTLPKSKIGFIAINFRGLAIFGDTCFHKKLVFQYVTFESHSHFRKANLNHGLDLDYSNIQNEMNFFDVQNLNSKVAKNNTSQETDRIIKHNFLKLGNKIEANKYLTLELEQKKNNLKTKPKEWLDFLVFFIHWHSSKFGTRWFRVLLLILSTSLVTIGFIHFPLLKEILQDPCQFKTEYFRKILDEIFQYVYLLNKTSTLEAYPKVLIFNKVCLGYLYYQFLVSIRKNTK
ncbi:MAG: hypothetical protein GY760_28670 [Deltaproteobacteria bacterium]|nr:hypothetical protein [Deltaproteobacteria bacterium]